MQYMAPEQIEGADADARTDIFAFGAVLFEMLTGRKAFQGKSETSLLAAILNEDPPTMNEIRNAVPPALDYLVRACLAEDPDARVQTAHDIWLQLKWIAEGGSGAGVAVTPDRSRPRRERAIWAAALIAVAALAAAAAWRLKPSTMVPRVVARFQYPLPETQTFTSTGRHVVAISPDGTKLVYAAPVVLVENVAQTGVSSAGQFGVSQTGSLVYVTAGSIGAQRSLVWVDRQGREQTIPAAANSYQQPRISPDGGRFVVSVSANIWIWSFASETLMRLTNDAAAQFNPAWTPDGRRVVYDSNDGRGTQILRKAADGTGAAEVVAPALAGFPEIVSPDEKYLVYHLGERISMLLPMNPRGPARRLLPDVKGQVSDAEISPDGRWIAYESDESGRFDIYVRPFPDVDPGRWQISSSGGMHPLWSRSGRELFFIAGDG